jgi:nucleoside-diphosphate-sugar epimerase
VPECGYSPHLSHDAAVTVLAFLWQKSCAIGQRKPKRYAEVQALTNRGESPDMTTQLPMRILVTGGTGFVGQAVLRELLQNGHEVVATTRRFSDHVSREARLEWVLWDGAKQSLPVVDWPQIQAILHLAAVYDSGLEHAPEIYELTAGATFRLLETARINRVPRVLLASTGDVLGTNAQGAGEDDVLYAPSSFYGAAKACAELLVRSYGATLSSAILRFYHPFGPGGDRFLVNRLVQWVIEGRTIKIEGPDGIRLNPVWIEDLAIGIRQAVESEKCGIFHFAGPQTVSLRELISIIGKLAQREPVIESIPMPGIQRHVGSFEETSRTLGYRPRVSLEEGLTRMLTLRREAA